VGEGSFLEAAAAGKPVVAFAALGHDVKSRSGHVFAVRKELEIKRPEDYRGKILVTRRSGPGDAAFFREFLRQAGVDLDRDAIELPRLPRTLAQKAALPKDKVLLVYDVFEDDLARGIEGGIVDGGYFHLGWFEQDPALKLVRPLHAWIDPELSSALLICRRDFLAGKDARRKLVLFLKAYIGRVRREKSLPPSERRAKENDPRWMRMDSASDGLNYPQYDDAPLVNRKALRGMRDLLRRQGALEGKDFDVEKAVDDSLVQEALR
jgi:ABC-type nitrate/sulfonate/bicarbonate transport system substrate-binding protein